MDAKTRKTEITLITLGTGVIFFGLWTLVKSLVSFLLYDTQINENLTKEQIIISNVVVWSIIGVSVLLNIYVGLSARAMGNGKDKGSLFLVVAGIIVFFRSILVVIEIVLVFNDYSDTISLLIAAFIDITTIAFLIDLMINAIRLKKIRKNASSKEGAYEL